MDSLFPEYAPAPRPVAARTEPMFELGAVDAATPAPDYGQAVAPVREARTPALLDVALGLPGENDTGELAFRFTVTD
ncbi:hypothetical protein [Lentzea sp. CA-135723]|uniref:hypothetical protein n=1 Tax=Lentzea sp. CA-135723 TaxID=3239950 RepID=UPI003D8C15CB